MPSCCTLLDYGLLLGSNEIFVIYFIVLLLEVQHSDFPTFLWDTFHGAYNVRSLPPTPPEWDVSPWHFFVVNIY